ncbi:prepilin peptidase [Companilactobacillus versmoldensis]|uniref:prepilin peptidase n=1 Tax=Companilactobacillus versmoldensis TaxID=194326 RepID=UPI0009765327
MLSLYYLTIFFTCASLVSFLTVVAQDYPDPKHRSVRRSHCDHCHCPLSWTHIIPILSYLSTFGKTHSIAAIDQLNHFILSVRPAVEYF